MKSAPINLDTIKFHLVWNKEFNFNTSDNQTVSLEELIEFLVESLEDADKAGATKAENLLTRIGTPAIPFLIQGLKSANSRVKSVCAMVLIRIGQPAAQEMIEFYVRNANRAKIRWVAEFVLTELGQPIPEVDVQEELAPAGKVLQLSKVG